MTTALQTKRTNRALAISAWIICAITVIPSITETRDYRAMAESSATEPLLTLRVRSSAFSNAEPIPPRFTCDGANTSPEISWNKPPANTASLLISIDDPDAPRGSWSHWFVYDIPPSASSIPQGASESGDLPLGSIEAMNDFRQRRYGGPCPPSGRHRYIITVRAIDRLLNMTAGASLVRRYAA